MIYTKCQAIAEQCITAIVLCSLPALHRVPLSQYTGREQIVCHCCQTPTDSRYTPVSLRAQPVNHDVTGTFPPTLWDSLPSPRARCVYCLMAVTLDLELALVKFSVAQVGSCLSVGFDQMFGRLFNRSELFCGGGSVHHSVTVFIRACMCACIC